MEISATTTTNPLTLSKETLKPLSSPAPVGSKTDTDDTRTNPPMISDFGCKIDLKA